MGLTRAAQLCGCSILALLTCLGALTLVNVISAKVGSIRVVGQEMLQEGGEVVAMPQYQVGTEHMLVHEAQVEVIAKGVHVHQVTDLVTLLRKQHGQLGEEQEVRGWELSNPYFPPGQRGSMAALPVAVGPAELPQPAQPPPGTFL